MCDLDPLPFDVESLAFDLPGSTWDGWPELGAWPAGDPPAAPGRAVRRCPTCGQPWPAADPSARRRLDIIQNQRQMRAFSKRNRLGA